MNLSTMMAAAAMAAPVALAQAQDNHSELIEWVFAPCMEVAAALDVGDLKQDQRGLGIKREHIAQVDAGEPRCGDPGGQRQDEGRLDVGGAARGLPGAAPALPRAVKQGIGGNGGGPGASGPPGMRGVVLVAPAPM